MTFSERPGTNVAEVDGNRTRRTGITRPTRFEGGGAHQALGHLPDHVRSIGRTSSAGRLDRSPESDRQEVSGSGVAGWMPELRHRPGLDLADTFAGEAEMLTDLF